MGRNLRRRAGGAPDMRTAGREAHRPELLAAQTELADQSLVAGRILAVQVVEEAAALRNELEKAAAGVVVLDVALEVPGQVDDALGEDRDLHFGGAGVAGLGGVFLDERVLALSGDRHRSILVVRRGRRARTGRECASHERRAGRAGMSSSTVARERAPAGDPPRDARLYTDRTAGGRGEVRTTPNLTNYIAETVDLDAAKA